jgi:hypothetical protein
MWTFKLQQTLSIWLFGGVVVIFLYILLLESMHNLIKFFQHNDIFVCDFVNVVKIC